MAYNEYFSIEQAEERLLTIKPLLEHARLHKREIEAIAASCSYDHILLEEHRPRLAKLAAQLGQTVEALEELGCYIKDLDVGIVDFLSKFEGRDIFLCWRFGEEKICHWHEIDESFAQREEILDLSDIPAEWEFETPVVENEN
jgi:hypothetical protein